MCRISIICSGRAVSIAATSYYYCWQITARQRRSIATWAPEINIEVIMSDNNSIDISDEEREADSRADMWSCVALIMLLWVTTMYWVSGQ